MTIFYRLAREYNWNVKNKASKGFDENYFFVFRNDKVYYNELETRLPFDKTIIIFVNSDKKFEKHYKLSSVKLN